MSPSSANSNNGLELKISPSILASDFSRLGEEVRAVIEAGADVIHLDVMDGHFAPNITFGPPVVAALRQHCSVPMEVHLMISDPAYYIDAFADAGADLILFHVEGVLHPHRIISRVKDLGIKVGMVLNPGTSQEEIDYLVDDLDQVLVMTVNPGFGGQKFIPEMLRKIEYVRAMIGERDLEVDGGIDESTAPLVVKAGANVLVAGSAIYSKPSYLDAIERIRMAAQ
ncbi:MAG: ribulose-phosphate 3-epimerase [FCB group bacterium]|jgi:ribulose-phosphate 3-epimerase|nr:ribulose-phosphate 3-epimerase [FCB group bacterium]